MSNNRDTQFAGFAKAVWGELETAIKHDPGFIPEGAKRRQAFLPMVEQIIARRAYDLVDHTFSSLEEYAYVFTSDIPDLPELPKEEEK